MILLFAYPFVCTLVMGRVAGRKQVIIALTACASFVTTWVGIGVARHGRSDPGFVFSQAFPFWVAEFLIASICAALALPLAMMRITLRREGKALQR